jgi:hypothetical protein
LGAPAFANLDDFAWRQAANEARSQERLSEGAYDRAGERRSRECPDNSATRFFYWRAHWLIQLMDSYSVAYGQNNRLRDMAEDFYSNLNTPIDDELHRRRLQTGRLVPPTAL